MKEQEMAQNNLIFKAIVGSKLYGTSTENSDVDHVGIFIPNKDYVLGLKTCEQVEIKTNSSDSGRRNTKEDSDTTLYSLPKFIKLATENNPNILEIFFVTEPEYCNEYGKKLIESYPYFISKKLVPRFLGYAKAQKLKVLNKNPIGERKKYIEQFGYDVKFASHIIRLLAEALDLLNFGALSFPLTWSTFIREIKEGKHSWEYVLEYANQLEELIKHAEEGTKIPNKPDFDAIENLQMSLLSSWWSSTCQ